MRNTLPPLRKNAIIIGDIIEDSMMVRDQAHEHVFRFGFLNHKDQHDALLDPYCDHFDVIVLGDGTLKPILDFMVR